MNKISPTVQKSTGLSTMANRESVQVTVRCRPPSQTETNNCWNLWEKNRIISNDPHLAKQHRYTFDNVLYGSDNHALYTSGVENLINQAMEGYNATVFAYGQTASGKTFTMTGTEQEPGVIPRSVESVFQFIKKDITREFLLRVSYLEIYNESIRDLLNPSNETLKISMDKTRGVYVAALTEEIVTCPRDVMAIIERGEANRHISSTDYNLHSSRSHCLFQMIIESKARTSSSSNLVQHRRTLTSSNYGSKITMESVRISQLNLIDLAGSEKAASDSDRRKEGAFINKSLLTLGTVISKLTETQGSNHIPFRDSKLTRILQTALSGMAKVVVICTISPSLKSMEESVNTLKFASRVKKIKINAKNDEVMDDKALIQKYRREIIELKNRLNGQNAQDQVSLEEERRDHKEQLQNMRKTRNAMKERIDELTKLILNSSSFVPSASKLEEKPTADTSLVQQLELQIQKMTKESNEKDNRIQALERELISHKDTISKLQTTLSIAKAELSFNQLSDTSLASPPQENLSEIDAETSMS